MVSNLLDQTKDLETLEATTSRLILTGLFTFALGVIGLVIAASEALSWIRFGILPQHVRLVVFTPVFLLMIPVGLFVLTRANSGHCRLELTPKRITVCSLRGAEWAEWTSLTPFTSIKRTRTVVADVTGQNVSTNVLKAGKLTVSAKLFSKDENVLAEKLNNIRRSAFI